MNTNVPYGWNVASHQAGMKDIDQVRDEIPPSLLQQGREYLIHSWTAVWCKRINCPFLSPISDTPRSHPPVRRLAQRVAVGAANYCLTTELGKWITSKSCKVSPLDCVCLTEGATNDPSLMLGSLEKVLCNITDMGRLLTELQKVLHASFEACLTLFLYLHWASL